jgi:hypothetical protein
LKRPDFAAQAANAYLFGEVTVKVFRTGSIARSPKYQRGHITILTAILFVIIGLTTMGMYNVGQQTTNKVRVQTVSDSAAFSVGTVVARDLNFKSITNRAMVANQIAIAQMVGLASWAHMLDHAATNFSYITQAFGWIPVAGQILVAIGRVLERGASIIESAISRAAPIIVRAQEFLIDALSAAQVTFHIATLDMARETLGDVVSQSDNEIDSAALASNGVFWGSFISMWNGQQERYRDQQRSATSASARENRARLEEFRRVTEASADRFVNERSYNWLPAVGPWPIAQVRMRKYGGSDLMPGTTSSNRENYNWTAMDSVGFEYRTCCRRFGRWRSWNEMLPFGWGAAHALVSNSPFFNYNAHRRSTKPNGQRRWGNGAWELPMTTSVGATQYGRNNLTSSRGLRPFYDLQERGFVRDDQLNVQVLLLKRSNNVRTYNRMLTENGRQVQPRFDVEERGGMAGNTLATLAKAGIYFSREHSRRRDGQREYGNMYNPYWQVHLLPSTNAERTAALAFAQVSI